VPFARSNGPRKRRGTPAAKLRNLAASRDERHVSPEDVEQYAYGDRFHGFRLDPVRDGLPDDEVLAELEAVGRPVLVSVGEGYSPEALEATLLRRGLPVIVAHFGGYPLNHGMMHQTIDLLETHDECYVDTSVVRYRDVLERGLREHPDRVLFGSGTPDVHPNVGIMELLTLDLPEDAMRRAFSKNADRIPGEALDVRLE
jgi:predicted TIM-barrel fold metal-dependent hydrolase